MGIFSACAEEAIIKEIIKWVEEHKETDLDRGFEVLLYEDLITFLEAKLKEVEYD